MSQTLSVASPKAIKQHRCSWCGQMILIGQIYMRYRWVDGGEAGTEKMHIECYDDMQILAAEEKGRVEFIPGEHKRPNSQNAEVSEREGGAS